MEPLKYFTREGNLYIKKNQTVLYCLLALFLFAINVLILSNNPNPGAKGASALFGLLGLLLLFRMTGRFRIDVDKRVISNQPMFFISPKEYRFEDFQNFLISRQTLLVTLNATASMVMQQNGKQRNLMVHQTMFLTKPLQQVTEEIADIMGITE